MNKLEALGLVETTSKTQKKNGTVCYHDPITDCDYLSYKSGYVRRAYTTKSQYGNGTRTIYQLNPQKKGRRFYKETEYEVTERILIHNPGYRMHLLSRAAVNYRNHLKTF
jgi:hypothetical protein